MPQIAALRKGNPQLEMARLFIVICMLSAGSYTLVYWLMNNMIAFYMVGFSVVSCLLLLFASLRVRPESIKILLLYFGIIAPIAPLPFALGGLNSFGTCWLIGPPAVALLLASKRHAFASLVISLISLGVCSYYQQTGYAFNSFPFSVASSEFKVLNVVYLSGLMITVFFLNFSFSVKERKAKRLAEQAQLETEMQKAKLQAILDSLDEAIISVGNQQLTVESTYSQKSHSILGLEEIAGLHIVDLFTKALGQKSSRASEIGSAIQLAINSDLLNYSINRHLLPENLTIQQDGKSRYLLLDWMPLVRNDEVYSILISIRDITKIQQLEEDNNQQKNKLALLAQVVQVGSKDLRAFIESSSRYISEIKHIIEPWPCGDEEVNTILRNIHTIKGNAKCLQLELLVDGTHNFEQAYQDLLADWSDTKFEHLLVKFDDIVQAVAVYDDVMQQFLGRHKGVDIDHSLSHEFDHVSSDFKNMSESQKAQAFEHLYIRRNFKTLPQLLDRELRSLKALSAELDKEEPRIEICGDHVGVSIDFETVIKDTFIHLLRNSIDHGIETPEERRVRGKPSYGSITIKADLRAQDGSLFLEVYDDGNGLDMEALRQKANQHAVGTKDLDDEAIANSIFKAGVSTAKAVTEISGRGVGLEAVSSYLVNAGGNIAIAFTSPANVNGYRPFRFVIQLPPQSAILI